jgi:glycosyltransferase involved in cell wall biosynthesis
MSKKVLYISYDGMTDPLGQSQVLPYLTELSKQGYRFTLLSFEKKERYEKEKAIIEKITNESLIQWVPLFFTYRPPLLSKMYDRWKLLRKAKQLQRKEKFDIVHCRSYIAAEGGLLLKKKFGTKFLFDMRGFWADERVDNGQWNLKNPIYKKFYNFYKKQEKAFLLNADGIVSLTKAGKDLLQKKEEYKTLLIDVIPCCADLTHFDFNTITQEQKILIREGLGMSSDKKVITYLGSIGGWYMTKEMFQFYKRLLLKYPEFDMLILTKDDKEKVIKEALEHGIPAEKIFVRYAKRQEVPAYLSISDCSIFFIRPTFSKTASSPTKHAELMGLGVPVICNDIGDTGIIIKATGTGFVVDEFSIEEYDKLVGQFSELLSLPADKIRESAFKYFDLKNGTEKYSQIYHRMLN